MPLTQLIRRLLLLALMVSGLAPAARAQTDQLNLEGNFPTRLEDAYATAFRNREFQTAVRYQRSRDHKNLTELRPALEYGILRNTQVSVVIPVRVGNGDRDGSGDVRLDALYNFNQESTLVPALAVAGGLSLPTGRGSAGADFTGRLIATKSLFRSQNRLHANLVYNRNNQAHTRLEGGKVQTERPDRWSALVGYSTRLAPQSVLVLDYVWEQLRFRGEEGSSLELGVRRQMNPRLVLSIGAAAGLSGESNRYGGTVGLQHAF